MATPTIALTPANGIWGYVYEWNGTPTNTTCIVTTQIDYGNHTKTFRVNVDNWNGAGSYKITPGPNDPPFPPNTQQQVVANNGGRVGYVTFNYGGGFQQAPILH
ncbi:MAG: hypothetical protein FJ218_01720 [Ignavibacteria bacterium]|nr:hypothetical protein [Ignavibacteria bacterium]